MSYVSSDHPRGSGKNPAASSERPAPDKASRPGRPEIIVGLLVVAVVGVGGAALLGRLGLDPGVHGLVLTSWSGVAVHAVFNLPTPLAMVIYGIG